MLINSERKLRKTLRNAETYREWREAAEAIDSIRGNDRWRQIDKSTQYDYINIRHRLNRLQSLRTRQDYRGLLFALNEGIHGNMGGMGKSGLYGKALAGTKYLIENYVDEIVDSLETLANDSVDEISFEQKLEFFRRAAHCFGRSALMMSGSGTLLFFHIGVVKTLLKAELLPDVLSGSSGGSLVGAMLCSHTPQELDELLDADFIADKLASLGRARGLGRLRSEDTQLILELFLPDLTFQQAYKLTDRYMNISIAPVEKHQTSRLLNAITSPQVTLRSAVAASTAVPGIFEPITLEAVDNWDDHQTYLPSRRWVDGSVSDDLPSKRLARLYGINHYIVSQTNPHVLPFVSDSQRKQSKLDILRDATQRTSREWFNALTEILEPPSSKQAGNMSYLALLRSVINQDYIGDINILPEYRFPNPRKLLTLPNKKDLVELIRSGERATWPKLEMIRQQTRISRCLDAILKKYEKETLDAKKRIV